jgi:hypothetical protein
VTTNGVFHRGNTSSAVISLLALRSFLSLDTSTSVLSRLKMNVSVKHDINVGFEDKDDEDKHEERASFGRMTGEQVN